MALAVPHQFIIINYQQQVTWKLLDVKSQRVKDGQELKISYIMEEK